MSQKILLLGANGFIGSHLRTALAGSDWATVVAAGRRQRAVRPGDRHSALQLDATDEAALQIALAGIDGVVNCVAGSTDTIVGSARALYAAAARQPVPPRVINLSSMAVYGAATGLVGEATPQVASDPYSAAKIAAEAMGRDYLRTVTLRPGIVYGPGSAQWTVRIARWLIARRLGDLGRYGDGYCNLVHVTDLVAAVLQALRAPQVEGMAFNIAAPEPPTWNEYLVQFALALDAVPVARIGRRRLLIETKLLAPPLKIAELVARRAGLRASWLPEALPPSLLRLCQQDIRLDSASAERALGLHWTPMAAGLRQAADWFRQQ